MKKTLLTVLPCLVTVAILAWLFGDAARRAEMAETLAHADARWLIGGVVLYGFVELGGILRWYVYLRVQGSGLSFGRAAGLFLIGLFFNSALPGSTGGDAVKIYYLFKETRGRQTAAFLSVVMDRIVGFVGLALVSGIFIALRFDWLKQDPRTAEIMHLLIIFLSVVVTGIFLSFVFTGLGWMDRLPARVPLRGRLLQLAAAYNLYGSAWRTSLLGFFISLPVHVGYFATFFCAARAMQAPVTFVQMLAVMPVVVIVTSIPISFGGVGVREVLLQEMLGRLCGVPSGTAILIGSTGFLMIFFWSLVGGLVYPFYRPTETIPDIQLEPREPR